MFKQVRPNENFRPSAEFHNATARLLNNLGTIGDGRFRGKRGGGTAYDGPFAVSISDRTIVINGGIAICGTENVNFSGYSLTSPELQEYVVFAQIYYDNAYAIYRISANVGAAIPDQGQRTVFFRLATIKDGVVKQCQFGDYTVGGRVV